MRLGSLPVRSDWVRFSQVAVRVVGVGVLQRVRDAGDLVGDARVGHRDRPVGRVVAVGGGQAGRGSSVVVTVLDDARPRPS